MNNSQDIGLAYLIYDLDEKGNLSKEFLESPLGRFCEEELRKEKESYSK